MSKVEIFHIARALLWPFALAAFVVLEWQNSVFLLLVLSVYANCASDIGAYQAARAERVERRMLEDEIDDD